MIRKVRTVREYFIRPVTACKFLVLNAFCLLLQSGCASQGGPPGESAEFAVRGKVSVTQDGERFSARFLWEQQKNGFVIELWGPLGQGRVRLEGDVNRLAIVDARGKTLTEGPAQAVMREHLGWTLPLGALIYWIRGEPTPELPVMSQRRSAEDVLMGFEQIGWTITCDDHRLVETTVQPRELPGKITAQRLGYRVSLIISQWRWHNV